MLFFFRHCLFTVAFIWKISMILFIHFNGTVCAVRYRCIYSFAIHCFACGQLSFILYFGFKAYSYIKGQAAKKQFQFFIA